MSTSLVIVILAVGQLWLAMSLQSAHRKIRRLAERTLRVAEVTAKALTELRDDRTTR